MFAVIAVLALACRAPALGPFTTVKIGLVAPLSGAAAAEGGRWVVAAQQAVHHWNATNEAPFKVELVVYDEADGPSAARNLVADPRVVGVTGFARPNAAAATAALALLGDSAVPTVVTGGPLGDLTGEGKRVPRFWLAAPEDQAPLALAIHFDRRLGPGPFAIVSGPEAADRAFAATLPVALWARELRHYQLPPTVAGYRDLVNTITDGNPRYVVLSVAPGAARTLIGLLEARRRPLVIGLATHSASEEALRDLATLDAYWASPFADPTVVDDAHWFVEGYRARTGNRPTPGAAAAQDGVAVLLATFDLSARRDRVPDRVGVAAALASGRAWQGALRSYRFDDFGTLEGAETTLFRMRQGLRFPGETVAHIPW